MPPKQATATPVSDCPKRTATAPAPSIETDNEMPMLKALQRQLAESQAQTVALQAALNACESYEHPMAYMDADYNHIAAAML